MGYRLDYLKDTARHAFNSWEWWERLVALALVIVSAVGYVGLWADWWKLDDTMFYVTAVASVGLFAWWVILFTWFSPAQRWHEHNESVHPIGDLDFGISTSVQDKTAIVYLEILDAPTGRYTASGRALNGGSRPVWPITWGLDSTQFYESIYPDIPRMNIGKVDWDDSTIRFVRPGKNNVSEPPEYLFHDPHGFAGNRCNISLHLGSSVFGKGYYELVVSVWWDEHKGLQTDIPTKVFHTTPIA